MAMAMAMTMAMARAGKEEEEVFRGSLKNLPQSIWGYSFASLSPNDSEMESSTKEVEALTHEVKNMLVESTKDLTNNINFIDSLSRLGISYHFESEIHEQLNHIFSILPKLLQENDYDLCTLAILFRVLRQNGYKMTCDVFKKFTNKDGEFDKSITNNVKSILHLYEACFLAIPGEDILDEALSFTRNYLQNLDENSNPPHLLEHIKHALVFPSHRTMERLDTLHYMSFYEQDESRNETLIYFAKMDFNRLQLLYKKELALLSKWWKSTSVVEKLPYARDRIIEAYIWAFASVFEPQYSVSRMLVCKYVQLVTLLDDTYDSYGTLDELHKLTTTLERFTPDAINVEELPEYLKVLCKFMLECLEETENEGCSYKTSYAKEMLKELARSYIMEATWQNERNAPPFEEYMEHGKVTSTYDFLTAGYILGAQDMGMKEIVWVRNDSQLISGSKFFARLMNDIAAIKDETKREDFPKGMHSYTKQHGVSQEDAIKAIQNLLENKWKGMNEEFLKPTSVPRSLLKYTFNFARASLVFYGGTDIFTYATHMKELILLMLIDPLPM